MASRHKSGDDDGAGKNAPIGMDDILSKVAEDEAALAADPTRSWADPTLPLSRYVAALVLEDWRLRFLNGERFCMMLALRECARADLPMPAWLARAYIDAFDDVLNHRVASFDDAFCRPLEKGKHLAALRKKRSLQPQLISEIRKLTAAGESIENAIQIAGENLGLGRSIAWEYYTDFIGKWEKSPTGARTTAERATTPGKSKNLRSDKPKG